MPTRTPGRDYGSRGTADEDSSLNKEVGRIEKKAAVQN
jgi:hypothetical protein